MTRVKRGESFHFKVEAINNVGVSDLSASVTILAALVPSEIENFAVDSTSSGSAVVIWDAPLYDGGSPLTGYYAYHKLTTDSSFTRSSLIAFGTTTYTFTLTADQEYIFKVTAANSEGESSDSDLIY